MLRLSFASIWKSKAETGFVAVPVAEFELVYRLSVTMLLF